MGTKQEILLETINPSDLTPEDLWELAEILSEAIPDFEFVPAYEDQQGAGVSWHEVLRLWVDNYQVIESGIFGVVLDHTYQYMRERFKKPAGKHRPKSVMVNNKQDRKEILNVVISDEDSEPVEVEVSTRIRVIPSRRPRE